MATPDIKSRSQRIQLDYFKRSDPLNRWRWILVLAAAVLAAGYAFYAATWGVGSHLSTGPLSLPHAHLEQSCSKCHDEQWAMAIGSDAWRPAREDSLANVETACQSCHEVANHSRSLLNQVGLDRDRNCANCHREHQGRQQRLTLVGDAACVNCHQDLTASVTRPEALHVRSQIERFSADSHGDFRSLASDSGRVHFNHFQHLQPGQVAPGKKGEFHLDRLPGRWQAAYRKSGQAADALVTLGCDDCHQLPTQTNNAYAGNADAQLNDRHYLPVRYSQHCVACHSLNYPNQNDSVLPLPHAAPWAEIETLVAAKMSGRQAMHASDQTLPTTAEQQSRTANRDTVHVEQARFDRAVQNVRQECLKCHLEDDVSQAAIQRMQSQPDSELIPSRWLKYGSFDHAAHRAVDCRFCHDVMGDPSSSKPDDQTVMIRGIESCTPCHCDSAPESRPSLDPMTKKLLGQQLTRASDQCTECHRYHWTRETASSVSQTSGHAATSVRAEELP